MSATALEGFLPQLGELTPRIAERWIEAALAVARALHEHDGWLYPIDPGRLEAAEHLHDTWRRWADDADALVEKARLLPKDQVPSLENLEREVRRIHGILGLPPRLIAQRREQALRGDVRTLEEVRRELRAGHRR